MRPLTSRVPAWRRETLRTNLWLVPSLEVLLAVLIFAGTYALDHAAHAGDFTLPSWVIQPGADGARQILTTMAAAVITVVGVVFSITIVALTLASTQFGPRMLRNFIRDRGTQHTLGAFVATFVYSVLALVAIGNGTHDPFVPHISITVALLALVLDMGVLIYFINHITSSIQLPQVIAEHRPRPLRRDRRRGLARRKRPRRRHRPVGSEIERNMAESTARWCAPRTAATSSSSHHDTLVRIASRANAVIRLHHRPGQFLVQGHPLATVWPPEAADAVTPRLERAHLTGPTARSPRTSASPSTSSSRSRSARCRRGQRHLHRADLIDWLGASCARSPTGGVRPQVHRDATARCALSRPTSATSGWSSAPSRRSARPAAACRP